MTDQTLNFVPILICAVCIALFCLNSKMNTKTARIFWGSTIISQIGVFLIDFTSIIALQVILLIVSVAALIVSIVYFIRLIKERKNGRTERD